MNTMADVLSFRENVVRPVLERLALWSPVAENLMVGTALQESLLTYTRQIGGPALGYFQCEPATHTDCWVNFLNYRQTLAQKVKSFLPEAITGIPDPEIMVTNPYYACAIARVKYYRSSILLPIDPNNIEAIAQYWKNIYNTAHGKGKPEEFVSKYKKWGL